MARYITIGEEFVNLDKVCSIQVYTRTNAHNDIVIAKIEFDHSIKKIPCAGSEEEVRTQIKDAIHCAAEGFCLGSMKAV